MFPLQYVGSFSVVHLTPNSRAEFVRLQLQSLQHPKKSRPVILQISLSGVKVCSPEDEKVVLMAHALKRISYATCDPDYGQFAFLARNPKGPVGVQYCHVFITQEDYEAEEINAIISKAFKVAYASIRSKKQFYELVDELNREQEEYFTQITRLAEEEELKARRPEALMANQPVLSSERVRGFSVGQSKVWAKQQAGKIQHKQPHLIAAMEAPPTLPTQPCDLSRGPLPPVPLSNKRGSLGSRLSEPMGDPSMRDSWVIVDPDSEVDPDGRPMSPSAPPLSPKDAYGNQEPVAKQTQKSRPLPPAPYYEVDFYNEWSLQSALGRNSALSVVSETDSNSSCQILLQDEHPPPALLAGIAPPVPGPHSTGQILLQDSSVPPPFVYGGKSGSENSFDDMPMDDAYAFENYKMDFSGRESVISAGSFDEEANFRYQLKCAEQFINAVYDVDSTEEDFARPKLSFRDKLKRKDHSEGQKENGHRHDDGDSALGDDEAERRGNISHLSDDSGQSIQNGHAFKMTGNDTEDDGRERCRADYAVPRTPAKAAIPVEPSAPPRPPPPPTSQEEGPSERKRPMPAPRRKSPEIVVTPPSTSSLLKVDIPGMDEDRPMPKPRVPRRPSADSDVILNGGASIVAAVSPMTQPSGEGLSRSSSRSNVIDQTPSSNAAMASSQRLPQSQQSTMQIGQPNGSPHPKGASSRYPDTNSSNNPRTQLDEERANSIVDTTYSGTPGSPDKRSLRSPGHVGHKVEVEIGQFRCKKVPLRGGPPPLPPRSTSLTEVPDDDDDDDEGGTAPTKGVVAPWFKAGIPKEIAFEILHQQEKGAFIVRESKSHPGSYALSMKVDTNFNESSLANYLLVRTKNGGYTIKGFGRDFPDLPRLVHYYTLHQDQLPCKLVISGTNPLFKLDAKDEMSDSDDEEDPDYRRVTDYKVMLEGAH
ncbi:uncharacterized protein LOC121428104 isoform X3 [Lytechinus variegatus]|uniref:uncharacterized protein LOC121428104 isoform X3 n=1 Tax=Lytechinus variegatus TaxID=7654 RepID=UPI001BB2370A|nr:uncharacterized protein LOC121428104 isoform X3 [Lytechinus variegatus]